MYRRYAPHALAAAAALAFNLHREASLDVGYHVRTGEIILREGVPRTNLFSLVEPERPWHDDDALFQVLLALAHRLGRLDAIAMLRALLVGGSLALALSVRPGAIRVTAPLACLFLFGIEERIAARPEWISAVFALLFLNLLVERPGFGCPADGRAGWLLPLLQALWANAHGYFIVGPFLVGLWGLAPREPRARPPGSGEGAPAALFVPGSRIRRVLLASACLLACVATPYGSATLAYPFRVLETVFLGAAEMQAGVAEFRGFPWADGGIPLPGLLALVAAGLLLVLAPFSLDRARAFPFSCALAFFSFALVARRNLGLFLLVAIPALADALDPLRPAALRRAFSRLRSLGRAGIAPEAAAAALAALAVAAGLGTRFSLATGSAKGIRDAAGRPGLEPEEAAEFWRSRGLTGPFLNNFNAGSWLVGRFFDSERVFIDGRPEVYGPDFFREYRHVMAGWIPLRSVANRHGLRAAFLTLPFSDSFEVLGEAARDPDWRLVFLDPRAAVLVRAGVPGNAEAIRRPRVSTDPPEAGDARLVLAHAQALLALGMPDRARKGFARVRDAGIEEAAYGLALAEWRAGDRASARAEAEALAPRRRTGPRALSLLGRMALEEGRTAEALARLREASRRAPRDPAIRAAHAQALLADGDPGGAVSECRAARAAGLEDPTLFEVAAEALAAPGAAGGAQAQREIRDGRERFPEERGLRALEARLLADAGDPRAVPLAEGLVRDWPGEPDAWWALGEAAFGRDAAGRAGEALRRFLELAPGDARAPRARAMLLSLDARRPPGPEGDPRRDAPER